MGRIPRLSTHLCLSGILIGLMAAGCTTQGPAGPPGDQGPPGDSMGTLSGTVTNTLTGTGVGGVAVALAPAIEGVDIVTGDDGTFSEDVPIGLYALTVDQANFEPAVAAASVVAGTASDLEIALTPVAPVIISGTAEGAAEPGGSVIVTASIDVMDGSEIESIEWDRASGVEVTITDADSETPTVGLPVLDVYKEELFRVLAEPPVSEEELPENVPLPEGEFPGGIPNRFQVAGTSPFSLEEAALVKLLATVVTTSGTYTGEVEVHTALPYKPSTGLHNVPVGVPVLLYGRNHLDEDGNGLNDETGAAVGVYDWAMDAPSGSTAMLEDAATQYPTFTPDVAGMYTITVTDNTRLPGTDVVTMTVNAGTWEGAITGQDDTSRPVSANCVGCHNGTIAEDMFTPWAQSGHAEIFTNNIDHSAYYSEECFSCHSVGFDPGSSNSGFDDADDFDDFMNAGLIGHPGDNWTTILNDFPDTAQLANIQCENCHGPQNGGAHMQGDMRVNLTSNVCGTCHGEPLRHGRFQQWQLSAHANYGLAVDEGESGSCSRCHTVNGFLEWLPILLDDDPATDPLADVEVTWTADEVHPQTCATCHDPHSVGTTTGVETDVTVRIYGDTPPLIAGFTVIGAGNGAICMTCHNTRRGLRNDSNFAEDYGTSDATRAPHGSAQTDLLVGENAYLVDVGIRGNHSLVEDTCVNCHMEQTPPPEALSYQQGGTNHTFYASPTICSKCHGESFNAEGVTSAFEATSAELKSLIEEALLRLINGLVEAGNTIDLDGEGIIDSVNDVEAIEFGEGSGRQAITVFFSDGTTLGPYGVNNVKVIDATQTDLGDLYIFADERLVKSGWNWNLVANDGSDGIHNPAFIFEVVDRSIDALNDLAEEESGG